MKYKILLNSKNTAIMKDFFQYMGNHFDCLSTSDNWQDIVRHFELFSPDAYICILDSVYSDMITQLKKLKASSYSSVPIIIVGSDDTCTELENSSQQLADLTIKRPISPDNLILRITRFFEENEAGYNRESSSENEKKHILIVDDDRNILKMLKNVLSEKYEVTSMLNGIFAEKIIETKKVDLIILDYEMPIETGAEVFRKIKKNEKAKNIPICFLTGVSERSKIEEIMSLKPHGYLLKPINMDMLLSTINNLTS